MQKRLLYIGSGGDRALPFPERFAGYDMIRLDADPATEPDILGDMRSLHELPEASFDAVVSIHSLEHVYCHEAPIVVAGARHVLKPGGVFLVVVPNLRRVCRLFLEGDYDSIAYISPSGPIRLLDIIYGYTPAIASGHALMGHKTGFTPKHLCDILTEQSFTAIHIDTGPLTGLDIVATAEKPLQA